MFGERSEKNHNNYVERILQSDDYRLKQNTIGPEVKTELENELNQFYNF